MIFIFLSITTTNFVILEQEFDTKIKTKDFFIENIGFRMVCYEKYISFITKYIICCYY
jgi:hypothetical protein